MKRLAKSPSRRPPSRPLVNRRKSTSARWPRVGPSEWMHVQIVGVRSGPCVYSCQCVKERRIDTRSNLTAETSMVAFRLSVIKQVKHGRQIALVSAMAGPWVVATRSGVRRHTPYYRASRG